MITGAHILLYSTDAEADRAFLRDVLGIPHVDVGHGWLIFGLPPAEMAVHPADTAAGQTHAGHAMIGAVLYLMCDDVAAMVATLATRGTTCTPLEEAAWGTATSFRLPSGGALGLYQPKHPTALGLWR